MRLLFFFKQKTSYEMRISDWSADVCSSDLVEELLGGGDGEEAGDLVAGDALSAADHGVAKANSTAKVDDTGDTYVNAAIAGSDLILTGGGNDVVSGGALATGDGASAEATNQATVTTDGAIGLDLANEIGRARVCQYV